MMTEMSTPYRPVRSRIYDAAVVGGGHAGFAAVERLRSAGWSVVWLDRTVTPLWEAGWAFQEVLGGSDLPAWQAWTDHLSNRGALAGGLVQGALAEVLAAERIRTQAWDVLGYASPVAIELAGDLLVDVVVGGKDGLHRLSARRWVDATDTGELLCLLGVFVPAPAVRRLAIHRRTSIDERLTGELSIGESLWDGWARLLSKPVPDAIVTHGSVVTWDEWLPSAAPRLPANVVSAVPAFAPTTCRTLADRYSLGWHAAGALLSAPPAEPARGPLPAVQARELPSAAVAVAGLGTGGALAALAAARAGASVIGIEPLPFAGGIGSGGGIHVYYFGAKGGLQEELDQRVRAAMPLFGSGRQVPGFHPDAKKMVFAQWFAELGIQPLTGTLVSVERVGRELCHALIATPTGPVRVQAAGWIDGTGDGDLCAAGGCTSSFGRQGDGLPHHFSQSSGKVLIQKDLPRMQVINFDQGFCDPRDIEDLTRARLTGIAQYANAPWVGDERPTYIAPALGLRQARQILTRATLTLADLIERRRFPDAVGVTGCHYDNHATDYAYESDDALYWVWVLGQWRGRTACDIPYGILVPRDLDNVWIASRCLGVSQDAHHSLRMQRDLQRTGEVAGLAAAQHAARGTVDLAHLRAGLEASGALKRPEGTDEFGQATDAAWLDQSGRAEWLAYRNESLATLREAGSWSADAAMALRGDDTVRERLWTVIESRIEDFDPDERDASFRIPRWWVAIAVLRGNGQQADLIRLQATLEAQPLPWALASIIATTAERILLRSRPADCSAIVALLERCRTAIGVQRGFLQGPLDVRERDPSEAGEHAGWQLHLVIGRARQAMGLPAAIPQELLTDERALVRRAFLSLNGMAAQAAS